MIPTMEQNRKDIYEIRTEFNQFKTSTNHRLDEIIDGLKPQFTKGQITTFLFSFIGIMATVFIWVGGLQSDISSLKDHSKNETLHMPFDKKIEVFVPRVELDSRLKNIEDTQNKMYNLLLK